MIILSHMVLEEIRRGGIGMAYRELGRKLDRQEARKVRLPELASDHTSGVVSAPVGR